MSVNPYPPIPISRTGVDMQGWAVHASVKARYASENASASSVITLTPDTTALEITVIAGTSSLIAGGAMRWVYVSDASTAATSVITAAGTANFDHVLPNNTTVKLAIPIETMYQAPSSMVGANVQNGLFRRVAIKSIGTASVLLTEF